MVCWQVSSHKLYPTGDSNSHSIYSRFGPTLRIHIIAPHRTTCEGDSYHNAIARTIDAFYKVETILR